MKIADTNLGFHVYYSERNKGFILWKEEHGFYRLAESNSFIKIMTDEMHQPGNFRAWLEFTITKVTREYGIPPRAMGLLAPGEGMKEIEAKMDQLRMLTIPGPPPKVKKPAQASGDKPKLVIDKEALLADLLG